MVIKYTTVIIITVMLATSLLVTCGRKGPPRLPKSELVTKTIGFAQFNNK